MGRAARWFKRLLGMNKNKEKSCVSGGNSDKGGDSGKGGEDLPTDPVWSSTYLTDKEMDQNKHAIALTKKKKNKHAIAVATATASAAEAAVSAAKAAAAVVKLTSEGRAGDIILRKEQWATVKIQKVFRGSLARKALRALKGIVKLQALVRGYLVRKRAAAMLQSIQALIRVQTAIRLKRNNRCFNKQYNDNMIQPRRSLDEATYNERSPKLVEMDETHKRRPSSKSKSKSRQVRNNVTMSEYEDDLVYKVNDLELSFLEEKWKFATTHNTPRLSYSSQQQAANNRYYVMQSPAKSVCGNALYDYESSVSTPGYMDKTQSFKAKVRSHSAPRQRYERKRLSLDEVMATRSSVSGVNMLQQQPQRYSCSSDSC